MIWNRVKRKQVSLGDLGTDRNFLDALYRIVLGREPDQGGLETHLARLESQSVSRDKLVREFVSCQEYQNKCLVKFDPFKAFFDYEQVADPAPFLPYVAEEPFTKARLCELVNPRKWLDQAWRRTQFDLQMVSTELADMHRKTYEITQTVYGLRMLGALQGGEDILGVGVGHEFLVYWLSNNAASITGTDLYKGDWTSKNAMEGDPSVLDDPDNYAPVFPYEKDRMSFLRMDGRRLEFEDDSFHHIYSLSSIEHFGGNQGTAKAMAEMGRVLKPGGYACIATEMVLNGKRHKEYFLPGELAEHVVAASGLRLIQAPEFSLPRVALDNPSQMPHETQYRPHLVLEEKGVRFTSVYLFLVKPA